MSYVDDIDGLEIEVAALDMMPEAFAREYCVLAVSIQADQLRILIPHGECSNETLKKLAIVVAFPLIIDTAERLKIDAAIKFHYPAKYAAISNCDERFRFRCPKRWYSLGRTDQRTVRYCNECKRRVYLCQTVDELEKHARDGQCVALTKDRIITMGLPL